MRIITLNANGIRAAVRKGFPAWLATQKADFVCLQEIRAQVDQIKSAEFWPDGYSCHYLQSQRPGYSGVAVYSRWTPDEIIDKVGMPDFDDEGRCLEVRVDNLSVVSLYLPSGTSGEERQAFKYRCMDFMLEKFKEMVASGRDYVVCGDWNIAHKEIDLRNWRGNKNNSGFLPQERAWLDKVYGEGGMVDTFRVLDPSEERYTWWSNRGQAWAKNVGWRLDLQVTTPAMARVARHADIYKVARFSDHAPLIMDYEYALPRRRRPRSGK